MIPKVSTLSLSFAFSEYRCIYLECRMTDERQIDREISLIHWFTPDMAPKARAGPGRSQEPGNPSGSSM